DNDEETDVSDDEEISPFGMMAFTYKDRGIFNCFTNMCGVSVSNTRKGTEVPEVVKDYNLNAHQVDNYDRLVEKFKFNHRLDKVTQVQIIHILFQILENSRVAYSNLMEFEKKIDRSEEHTSELQSRENLVCRLL